MRIITGLARGKRLVTVPGEDLVRPTPEKVKEAIFSSIQFDIEGRKILDLFAGCGQLGIEALSRGAMAATFVDNSDISLKTVKQNLEGTVFADKTKLLKSDYKAFLLRNTETFDIAFLDPPYNAGILEDALDGVIDTLSDYGIIICEHPDNVVLPDVKKDFSLYRNYKFGKIRVSVYKKGDM